MSVERSAMCTTRQRSLYRSSIYNLGGAELRDARGAKTTIRIAHFPPVDRSIVIDSDVGCCNFTFNKLCFASSEEYSVKKYCRKTAEALD